MTHRTTGADVTEQSGLDESAAAESAGLVTATSDDVAMADLAPSTVAGPLSRLVPVGLTSVWPTEARHFTPWLLENAELLGEALGIDLELEVCEHPVGRFFLDILGKDLGTGGVVIVENQFGSTDHGHLGQLLTYAGGTEPTTVVWIAERFSQEHRAALGWLNRHTVADVRFFGVQVSAVTLKGAPPGLVAPMFDVVVEPNEWERNVRDSAAGGGGTTARQELYREFWTQFEPIAKARHWTNATAPAQNWWSMPAGVSGVEWGVSFAQFGARSELYFGDRDPEVNLARWKALEERRSQIEQVFGGALNFDELPGKQSCRIEARLEGPSVTQRGAWETYRGWFADTQEGLRKAVAAVGGVPRTIE